jgi:Zn finger protein HypA/HybF involved in hydrogenase expression
MTGMDMPAFSDALKRTGAVFSKAIDGDLAEAYHLALADIPFPIVEAGLLRCQRGAKFFPRPAQIREACDVARATTMREPVRNVEQVAGAAWCERCEDTGWEFHECSAAGRCYRCHSAKVTVGYDHRYVTECPCRGHNPVYQRIHAQKSNYHQEIA